MELKETQKLVEQLLHIRWTRKNSHLVGEAETESHVQPHPWHRDPQSGRNPQTRGSPWGANDLNSTSGTPTFNTCTWEVSTPKFRAYVYVTHKAIVNWEIVLKWLVCTQGPAQRQLTKKHLVFLWKKRPICLICRYTQRDSQQNT